MRWLVVLVCVPLLIACLGDDEDPAATAAKEVWKLGGEGKYAEQWEMLHPAHQQVVSEDAYVSCSEAAVETPIRYDKIEVLETADEEFTDPKLGTVTTRMVRLNLFVGEDSVIRRNNLVEVDGDWRWLLDGEWLTAFESGGCPV